MILIKNAHIHQPDGDYHDKKMDILIENRIIERIEPSIDLDVDLVIEHKDLNVSVGWFDSSVSFGEPGFEERQTMKNGMDVAASSGFTNIMLNPNNKPNPQDASGVNYLKSISAGHATTLHPVGNFSIDQKGDHLAELFDMHNAGAVSFYDFKNSLENANLLKVGLQYVKPFDGVIQSFPQDAQIAGKGMVNEDVAGTQLGLKTIPKFAEELRVSRDIEIARYTGADLHIPTITTGASLELIKKAKKDGLKITCSVSVHHLLQNSEALIEYDTNFKVQPPLRDPAENKNLIKHIKSGTVDMITSDHTPLAIESKEVEFDQADYGTIGLESVYGALSQKIDQATLIKLLTAGYEVFLKDSPKIEVGAVANLTFFTTEVNYTQERKQLKSTSKNSLFIGMKMKGKALGIYNNGKLIWNE
ncbi:dihydroorotase [Nonlabens sp. Hel1_33_55]|uniref:dihydroorotase n=1 Tax=Nonlabens sp. Hel1_33_55 TaxID=1336802 RepID=UPI000875CFFD|nr:dihydroorotase [Nonlabens sp. Hel1_33_55]SCY10945.1 dihydroorotase [Nonlabens sp. Hel1_33_55]